MREAIKRRDFLRRAAATAGAVALQPHVAPGSISASLVEATDSADPVTITFSIDDPLYQARY